MTIANATNTQVKLVLTGTIRNGKATVKVDPSFAPVTQIDADPALATPFQIGVMDAEDNYPFAPEMIYVKAQHKLEYAMGFASIRPDCEPAQDMITKLLAGYMAELDEQRDETYDLQYPF